MIRILNRCARGSLLGPLSAGACEPPPRRLTSPGRFRGTCAVHPSGRPVLVVGG